MTRRDSTALRRPRLAQLERLLDTLIRRITRTLVRAGVLVEDGEQPYLDLEPSSALEQLSSASTRYRIAVGPIAGRRTMRIHTPSAASCDSVGAKPLTAARDGFSLNAAVACQARQRAKLERLCRYMSRPPIALQRLSLDGDGLVVYELKHPFRDGTTHVLFEPLDLMAHIHVRHPSGGLRPSKSAILPIGHGSTGCFGAAPACPLGSISRSVCTQCQTTPPHHHTP